MNNDRVHGLEGARGLAAFWVFTHHFLLIFHPDFYFGEHTWIHHIFNADLAVAWFFVHSGFVLSYKSRNIHGAEFWYHIKDQLLRRYIRLVPVVLFSILLTYVFLKLGLTWSHEYAPIAGSTWLNRYFHFEPNIIEALKQAFYGVYFEFKSSTTYDPNLWTIGSEMISSYILFGILAIFGQWKWAAIPFAILGLYIGTWKGLMCFLLGAALTRVPTHKTHPAILIILAIGALTLTDLKGPHSGYLLNIGAFILMYVLLQSPKLRDVLHTKPILRLGELSYSFYSIHFLLLTSLTSYLGLIWQGHKSFAVSVLIYIITTIVLMIVSYGMWKWVDGPGIRLGKAFSKKILGNPGTAKVPGQ